MTAVGVLRFWTGDTIGVAGLWFTVPIELKRETYESLGAKIEVWYDEDHNLLDFTVL